MAMEYFNYIKSKTRLSPATKSEEPVLSEDDEKFLNQIASPEDQPPALPPRPNVQDLPVAGETSAKDAQIALMDGAQNIPLPQTPDERAQNALTEEPESSQKGKEKETEPTPKSARWSWLRRDSRDTKRKHQRAAGESLFDAAQGVKPADAKPNEDGAVSDHEAEKEEEDMAAMLEQLNLAAVNNRVFSISDETQELLKRFNQIFKDLIRGVPTAYDDLESLLTNGDQQLQKTFSHMPGFLQKLIEQLPEKMTQNLAPEMMAAAAARAEKSGINMENAGKAAGAAKKMGFKAPALKDLIGKPGAAVAMLRSIMAYLRARFPAFMGMNVLWSLAMFVLLIIFWYCHKRGREVRLDQERELTEKEVRQLDAAWQSSHPDEERPTTTTAPDGAPMEEVEAGMRAVEEARQAVRELDEAADASTTVAPGERVGT